MTKKERATFVINTLKEIYPTIPIPLDHKDPYTLLIAVLLSAQCTDVRVNKITPLLFAKADNPHDMIKMSVEEIAGIIRHCTYQLKYEINHKFLSISWEIIHKVE